MSADVKRIQSICISVLSIQRRLAYIRAQIEKCEEDIPSKLWCKDCKDRIKKIKRLLDKLQEAKTHPPLSDKIFTPLPENYGYASAYDDDDVSIPSTTYQYVCLDCGAGYIKKEDLGKTWKLNKNMWSCPKCFSTNIVHVDSDGEQGLNGNLR